MKKKKEQVAPEAPKVTQSRQFRDRLTRVDGNPIKGQDTNAKQWDRWTP